MDCPPGKSYDSGDPPASPLQGTLYERAICWLGFVAQGTLAVRVTLSILFSLLAIAASVRPCLAIAPEEQAQLRYHHAWGRCGEGSWQAVRMVSENLDEKGQVTSASTTETRTTVEQIAPNGVTLRVEVVMDVGGKRMLTQPQIVRQDFSGALTGENVTLKKLAPTSIVVNGQQVACESQELEILSQGKKKTSLICFSEKSPCILKRNIVATESSNPAVTSETTHETIELDMPYKVLGEVKKATLMRIVQKNSGTTTVTVTVNVPDIPGEVVAHTSKKLDADGRVVRRSTLELVGYRCLPLDPNAADGKNWVPRRHRRSRG